MTSTKKVNIWCDGSTTRTCHIFDDLIGAIVVVDLPRKVTVNEGEYYAIIHALQDARGRSYTDIVIYSDSEVATKQLNREYKLKAEHLKLLANKVRDLQSRFNSVEFYWISRDINEAGIELDNRKKEVKRDP